jgi:hypothetical protein
VGLSTTPAMFYGIIAPGEPPAALLQARGGDVCPVAPLAVGLALVCNAAAAAVCNFVWATHCRQMPAGVSGLLIPECRCTKMPLLWFHTGACSSAMPLLSCKHICCGIQVIDMMWRLIAGSVKCFVAFVVCVLPDGPAIMCWHV